MFKLVFSALLGFSLVTTVSAQTITINGAGATFPYPIYAKWAFEYSKTNKVQINYQSIGSGGGIAQIKAKTVDFGASDAPMTLKELDETGLMQFPLVIGGVVPVVKLEGIKENELVLTPEILSELYLGTIKKWNDPKIIALNKTLKLPNIDVSPVYRSDGSGTTWIFTNYLTKVSKDWATKVGEGKAVKWPVGLGAKGNEGVAANIQRINGSLGYVEYAYATENKLTFTKLQNKDGKIVSPTIESFQESAKNADWNNTPGFAVVLTDINGEKTWPISGASFVLIYKNQKQVINDIKKTDALLNYFIWSLDNGDKAAKELNYVPIPEKVAELIKQKFKSEIQK